MLGFSKRECKKEKHFCFNGIPRAPKNPIHPVCLKTWFGHHRRGLVGFLYEHPAAKRRKYIVSGVFKTKAWAWCAGSRGFSCGHMVTGWCKQNMSGATLVSSCSCLLRASCVLEEHGHEGEETYLPTPDPISYNLCVSY